MDKDHRLDAPDNDSLRTIEQLNDHSELTTIYPHAHSEWEGAGGIVGREERERQHSEERLRISLSLRKWFLPIGLLLPLPFIVIAMLATLAANYFNIKSLGYMLLPALIFAGFLLYLAYRGYKYGLRIFYKHGVNALPFVLVHFGLLFFSINIIFLATEPLHTGEQAIDMLIIGAATLLASIVYSLLLVLIWSSPRLSATLKIACIGIMYLAIFISLAILHLF